MKLADYQVVFREFPDEITLALNISNCPCHCPGCHSSYLWEDVGEQITLLCMIELIDSNPGITCIGIMGGDANYREVESLARMIKSINPKLKVGWYSGRDVIPRLLDLNLFSYIKLGPYIESKGGLDNPNTNQRMYKVVDETLVDITSKMRI